MAATTKAKAAKITEAELASAISVKALAERLGLTYRTTRRLCAEGHIKSVRVGSGRGTIKITERAIAEYLDKVSAGAA